MHVQDTIHVMRDFMCGHAESKVPSHPTVAQVHTLALK
jgi:hypothetical protein